MISALRRIEFAAIAFGGSIALVFGGCGTGAATPVPRALPDTALPSASAEPSATPTATVSSQEIATRQAVESISATWEAVNATEMAALPECGWAEDRYDSPDGKWIAIRCIDNGLGVYFRTDPSRHWYFSYYDLYGAEYQHGNRLGHLYPLHWSSDGKSLYFVARWSGDGGCPMYLDGSALYRLDLGTGVYSELIADSGEYPYGSFSIANDDAYAAHIPRSPDGHAVLVLLNLATKVQEVIPLGDTYKEGGSLIWSPDNQRIVFSARSGDDDCVATYYVVLMNLADRSQKIMLRGGTAYLPVSWESANQVVLQTDTPGELFTLDLVSGKVTPRQASGATPTP